jgi:hypothetical protein
MPVVVFNDDELEALLAVHTIAARVDWSAYDRARQRIVEAGRRHLESKSPRTVNDVAAVAADVDTV